MLKQTLKSGIALLGAFLFLILLVLGLGRLTWRLMSAPSVPFNEAVAPERHPAPTTAVHSVAEWPIEKARDFGESPALRALVEAGDLPPASERLPANPLVIVPPHQCGPYGGSWKRFATGPDDIGIVFASRITYEGLLRWDAMGRKILPNLATSWDIEDGGRSYTFHLRKDVRWSDGHLFTVDDILFWYRDVLSNKELTPLVGRVWKHGGELVRVEKINDYTVRFRFKKPHGLFLKIMASGGSTDMLSCPAHYLKQFHATYATKEILKKKAEAAGFDLWRQFYFDRAGWRNKEKPTLWAWTLKDPPPARPVLFERNPYYWKVDPRGNQLPYIDSIAFDIYTSETIQLKAINGEMGMQLRHFDFENYSLFMANRKRGDYRVLHWAMSNGVTMVLALNQNHRDPALREIFADRRFRIALSLALNRNEINEICYLGAGKPRQCSPPPGSPFYSAAYEKAYTKHDQRRANDLLDEMGLRKRDAEGFRLRPDGKPLTFHIETTAWMSTRLLELVCDHWRSVGVNAKVKQLARQLWYQRKRAQLHDASTWSGADEFNPVLDPRWFFPVDRSSYQAPGFGLWYATEGKWGTEPTGEIRRCMDLFEQIRLTPDDKKQVEIFRKIIDLNRENLWVIGTIGELPVPVLVRKNFRNVPEVALHGWQCRTPGNTAPECYAIEQD